MAVEHMKNFIERNYKNDDNYLVKGITMGEEGEFRYVEVDFSKEGNPEDVEKFSYHKRYKMTENESKNVAEELKKHTNFNGEIKKVKWALKNNIILLLRQRRHPPKIA